MPNKPADPSILGKKLYFASDAHLGMFPEQGSRIREIRLVQWLEEIRKDAVEIYLLGDIFDFWYEYPKVVPRGFTRFLGKISEICDSGIPVHFFTGNHDGWIFDYLASETGMIIHQDLFETEFQGKKILMGHGDGLGPQEFHYRLMKRAMHWKWAEFIFSRIINPNFGVRLAHFWSKHSRLSKGLREAFLGTSREYQIAYCMDMLKKTHYDYFIFGHRHLALDIQLAPESRYICLGEWVEACTYAVLDDQGLSLRSFAGKDEAILRKD